MAEEKVPEQTLSDSEITEVKQPRRKFLMLGVTAVGLVGAAMSTSSCGADRCDADFVTDNDTGARADPANRPLDSCDTDS